MTILDRTIGTLKDENLRFREHYVNLKDIKCVRTHDYKSERGAGSLHNLLSTKLEFQDQSCFVSSRFWISFCAKVGVSPSIFNLFTHEEVFERCKSTNLVSETGNIRIVEDIKNNQLLAISDPSKSIIHWDNAFKLLEDNGAFGVSYHEGIIQSYHNLPNDTPMKIGFEDYDPRIVVATPVDGYGNPTVYLALIRDACQNGLVAFGPAFKTIVRVSKSKKKRDPIEFTMERMFNSFSNDEGFDALVRRIDAARYAPLSVREFHEIQKIMQALPVDQKAAKGLDRLVRPEVRFLNHLAGDLNLKYGLSHLQEMTERQMGLLETDLTLYETFNFITELCTYKLNYQHPIESVVAKRLYSWLGRTLSKSYDLEGTIDNPKNQYKDKYF